MTLSEFLFDKMNEHDPWLLNDWLVEFDNMPIEEVEA